MTVTLHAQPYDIDAAGFYFANAKEYAQKAGALKNRFGDPVEEFEIQFIDGDAIDGALAAAIGLHQANLSDFLTACEIWDDEQKRNVIIAVGESGYDFDPACDPDQFDIDIHEVDTMRDLAEYFVQEGLFGEIPESLQNYLDFDAIARDLSMDYTETEIAGTRLIYRCI